MNNKREEQQRRYIKNISGNMSKTYKTIWQGTKEERLILNCRRLMRKGGSGVELGTEK